MPSQRYTKPVTGEASHLAKLGANTDVLLELAPPAQIEYVKALHRTQASLRHTDSADTAKDEGILRDILSIGDFIQDPEAFKLLVSQFLADRGSFDKALRGTLELVHTAWEKVQSHSELALSIIDGVGENRKLERTCLETLEISVLPYGSLDKFVNDPSAEDLNTVLPKRIRDISDVPEDFQERCLSEMLEEQRTAWVAKQVKKSHPAIYKLANSDPPKDRDPAKLEAFEEAKREYSIIESSLWKKFPLSSLPASVQKRIKAEIVEAYQASVDKFKEGLRFSDKGLEALQKRLYTAQDKLTQKIQLKGRELFCGDSKIGDLFGVYTCTDSIELKTKMDLISERSDTIKGKNENDTKFSLEALKEFANGMRFSLAPFVMESDRPLVDYKKSVYYLMLEHRIDDKLYFSVYGEINNPADTFEASK